MRRKTFWLVLLCLLGAHLEAQQWVVNQSPNRDLAAGEGATFTLTGGTPPTGCSIIWADPFTNATVAASSITVSFPRGGAWSVAGGYAKQERSNPSDPNSPLVWNACGSNGASRGVRVYEPPVITSFKATPAEAMIDQTSVFFEVTTHCGASARPDACGGSATNGALFDPGDGSCSFPFCNSVGTHIYRRLGTFSARAQSRNQAGSDEKSVTVTVVETRPPVSSFSWRVTPGEPPQIAGNPIRFQSEDFTSGGVRSWEWDFGDGGSSTEENPTHTFAAADDYVVTLTVTNRLGRSTSQQQISIAARTGGTPPASASFTFSPPSPVTGQRVQFADRSTGAITRWRWNFESVVGSTNIVGAPLSYEQNPSYTFDTPQRKNVQLTVSNAFGSRSIILFVDVLRADQPPLAKFSFEPFSVTVGVPVQFTDESFGATSWLWDFGEDGATSTQQNPRYTYRTEGQKGVTLRVSNAFGSDSTTKFFACHGDAAKLEALFTWTPTIPRPGEEVRFTDLSTGAPEKWAWTVSDGSSSNLQNWTHRFAAEGDFIVGLRIDKGASTHQTAQTIRVRAADQPVARFAWSPVQPDVGQEVRFENQSQNATRFEWQFDDGTTSTDRNPVHTFREARTYIVRLFARNDAGAEHSVSSSIVVGGAAVKPVALFDVSPNPAKVGQPVQFIDRSTGRPTFWSWTFGHNGATSNLQNPVHTFTAPATYTVTLVVENSAGRSEERGIGVIVKSVAKPVARFRVTPSNPKIGQTVTFTDDSDNDPTSWTWTFGDGGTGSGRQVTHTYSRGGKFNVKLEAANDDGRDSVTNEIFIGEDLLVDFTMTPAAPIANRKVTFTDATTGNPDSREWLVDGLPRGQGSSLEYTFLSDGVHRVELRVKRGTETSFRQKEFDVVGPPVARIRYEGTAQVGREITFQSATTQTVTNHQWLINGNNGGTTRTTTTTFKSVGKSFVSLRVDNVAGSDSVTVEVDVQPRPATERPNITRVLSRYGPCYFHDSGLIESYDVGVAWRTFDPQRIDIGVDGAFRTLQTITGNSATILFPTDDFDDPVSRVLSQHTVSFTAVGARPSNGTVESSDPEVKKLFVFRLPDELNNTTRRHIDEPGRQSFVYGLSIPVKELDATIEVPKGIWFLGGHKFGIEDVQYRNEETFRTDCTAEGSTELEGAVVMAGGRIGLKGYRKGGYALSKDKGVFIQEGSAIGYEALGEIEREEDLGTLLGPASAICASEIAGSLCKFVEVRGKVGIIGGGEWSYVADPKSPGGMRLSDNTGTIKIRGLIGAELKALLFKLEVEASLSGGITFGAPTTERNFFRRADLTAELFAKAQSYVFSIEYQAVGACSYIAPPPSDPNQGGFTCGRAASLEPVATEEQHSLKVIAPHHGRELETIAADGSGVVQDVSPLADPATAFRDERIVTVYLTENASAVNPLHRTDLRYVRNDGQAWSQPKSITTDALGEFHPDVVFRDASRAVALWERSRNASLTSSDMKSLDDLGKWTREMEIVAATYDYDADRWSAPEALTDNSVADVGPRVAALADGRVLAVWVRDAESGSQQIVSRILSGSTWGAEAIVATGVKNVERIAIAARANEAQLVYQHDVDIAAARFKDGAWEPVRELTKDPVTDAMPQVVYAGEVARVIWSRDGSLVWSAIGSEAIEVIRAGDASMSVLDARAIASPAGLIALVRSEATGAVAQLWDPTTRRWSSDVVLRDFSARGNTVSPSFYGDDTLLLVTLESTATRSDLVASQRHLRVDLRAAAASTSATPARPRTGERVTVSASFENRGEIAVSDVPVHLYAGRTLGALPIATTTIAGSWVPGEPRKVDLTFDASPATSIVTIVVDPEHVTADITVADNAIRHAFANVAPTACFQASALSGSAPLDVRLDASCSRDLEGPIVSYGWNIASGTSVSATPSTTHRFDQAGSYPVTLRVTDEMGTTSTRTATVEVAGADRRSTSADHSLYLSVAARSAGVAGSYFVSDLDLLNTDSRDLEVDAVFLPDGRSDAYHEKVPIPGGTLLRTSDVVANLFSAANGAGSIRLDLSHPHAVAVARTYNDQPAGTAGFSNEMVRRSAALNDGETGVILQHWLPGYRTNIGFTEIGGTASEITVSAFDERGVPLGSQTFSLGAYQHQQLNGIALLQARGRIDVAVRGGSVLAYASTVDGQTGDPIYQSAQRVPSSKSTLLIPIVSRLSGLNNSTWRSDVRVFNPMSSEQAVSVDLATATGRSTATLTLKAGETASFDDVVARLFPQLGGSVGGALVIRGTGPLLGSSRTFNLTPRGTFGLYVPAREEGELLAEGDTAYLVQLQENEAYRCNFGMTSLGGAGRVALRAFDARGNTLATKEYAVAADQNMQVGRVLADMGVALPVDAAVLEVRVLEGRLFAYASVNDNRTGDGTFVEATR